jgi:hypothetical protein
MRKTLYIITIALIAVLVVLATKRARQLKDPMTRQVPGAGMLNGEGDGFAIKDVTFRIEPEVIRICEHPDLRVALNVTWDTSAVNTQAVTIWVDDGTSGARRWMTSGSSGHAETGNWIADNTTLRLVDTRTNKTLAMRRVHAMQCLGYLANPPSGTD